MGVLDIRQMIDPLVNRTKVIPIRDNVVSCDLGFGSITLTRSGLV